MGGKLWLESRLGNGSTFHFTIRVGLQRGPSKRPATFTGDERSGRADTRGERPGPGGAATARPLRILLAEDTRANQKLVVFILRKQGHSVEVADNGAKALELVRRHDFDLVLMDVQMPDMDGLQATREIRALADPRKARVPIVAMTAYAMKGDQSRCLDAGMDAYLSKPVDADELIETIQRMAAPGPNTGKGAGGGLSQFSFACPGGQAENGTVPLRLAPRPGAEEPVAVCEPIFDAAGALAHCAGQQSILADMASFYLDNVGTWIDELRGAAEAGAAAELSHLAHRLRGTLLYLAARPSERLAGEVEQLAASSGAAGASAALERLIASLGPLEEALRQFRPT
jgi:CheY-like chemotaxis protein